MADDIDAMLQGSTDQNPASQAQTQGQGTASSSQTVEDQQTPEEVEFSKLSGNAQERIRKLVNRAVTAEQKAAMLEQSRGYTPPAPTDYQSPENQAAIQQLEKAGIATDRKVESKIDERLNQVLWNFEQSRLESKYNGSDGTPRYDRQEVEDYIRTNPQFSGYAAEDVFRYKMFPDEFLETEVRQRTTGSRGTMTLKPTKATVHEETLTPEYIAERTDMKKYPDARQWYDEHLDEINEVLKRMVPLNQ